MDANRANTLGVQAADVQITSSDRYGHAWLCWVADATRPHGQLVLASFAASDVFGACAWRARLERFNARA